MNLDLMQKIDLIKSSPKIRLWFLIAFTTVFLSAFVIFSSEVQEAANGQPELISDIDRVAELMMRALRNPKLNSIAVDITALGSGTLLTIFVLITSLLLLLKHRFSEFAHISIAAAGSGIITSLLKTHFERTRPIALPHLVDVQGYSYPSGHSLSSAAVYLTLAVLLCHLFKKKRERFFILSIAMLMITLIALSRVYLGVHYASDTIAGVLLGTGWAACTAAVVEILQSRKGSKDAQ